MQNNQSPVKERNKKSFTLKVTVWTRFAPGSCLSIHEAYQAITDHIKTKQNNRKKLKLTKSTEEVHKNDIY